MFHSEQITRRRRRLRPIALPIKVLWCLPPSVHASPLHVSFDLFTAMHEIAGKIGTAVELPIVNLEVWAPGWNSAVIDDVLHLSSDRPTTINSLRVLTSRERQSPRAAYEVVHLDGFPAIADSQSSFRDILKFTPRLFTWHVPQTQFDVAIHLARSVTASQRSAVAVVRADAVDIATEWLADLYSNIIKNEQLPQTTRPTPKIDERLSVYLAYDRPDDIQWMHETSGAAEIAGQGSHGFDLEVMVDAVPAREVHFHREGPSTFTPELPWNRLAKDVGDRLARIQNLSPSQTEFGNIVEDAKRQLHPDQLRGLLPTLERTNDAFHSIVEEAAKVGVNMRNLNYSAGGPAMRATSIGQMARGLAKIDDDVTSLESRHSNLIESFKNEVRQAAQVAPRVLNANFAAPNDTNLLAPSAAMKAGQEYDLLVDVGPRWNHQPSIVAGHSDFPESALPPGEQGYLVQVTFVSHDFSPHMISGEMWVSRGTGRSFPHINGQRALNSGPIALRVRAPQFPVTVVPPSEASPERPTAFQFLPDDSFTGDTFTAHGRLCLYYRNNLLQSALVEVSVSGGGTEVTLEKPNKIEVDYRLTGSFQGVERMFGTRNVSFDARGRASEEGRIRESPEEDHPIALNLTMNHAGIGGHRIVVRGGVSDSSVPGLQGWTPYDPEAVQQLLNGARSLLIECFCARDDEGNVITESGVPVAGLDSVNGRALTPFKWDLTKLAELGSRLFDYAFSQMRFADSAVTRAQWNANFAQTLRDARVIQISRTGQDQYVFPWALVYEYPLITANRENWTICRCVNDEWSVAGIRDPKANDHNCCPYAAEAWHQADIICPYGFWGFKHIVEEPPSVGGLDENDSAGALNSLPREIHTGAKSGIGIGITHDPAYRARIDAHLGRLGDLALLTAVPQVPADTWPTASAMMHAPELVYFLCHGTYDSQLQRPYLSVGLRDGDAKHRIYQTDLAAWTRISPRPPGPDLDLWQKRRPFVFINGCHTADLQPGQILSYVSTFANLGASGVLGTEISVVLPVAIEVAESLYEKLTQPVPMPVGQALREIRWQLLNKGNVLGLAYTLYALADLHIVRDQ